MDGMDYKFRAFKGIGLPMYFWRGECYSPLFCNSKFDLHFHHFWGQLGFEKINHRWLIFLSEKGCESVKIWCYLEVGHFMMDVF